MLLDSSLPAAVPGTSAATLAAALRAACTAHAGVAQRHPAGEGWASTSYPELAARVRAVALGLLALGVEPGDRVAIVSRTRGEWTIADLAILAAGAAVVPVYETNSPDACRYVLEHAGARVAFCDDEARLERVRGAGAPEGLQEVVLFEPGAGGRSLAELEQLGRDRDEGELDARGDALRPEDLATIVYTSGTTGPPKGCVLTQANLLANARMVLARIHVEPEDVIFTFLPLAHVLTRITQMCVLFRGAQLAYWRGDTAKILDDLAEVRPTILPSVPRVFEKAHTRVQSTAREGSRVKRALFGAAVAAGGRAAAARRDGERPNPAVRAAERVADRVALGKVRAVFGGRMRLALVGGAPIDPAVIDFFDACGVPLLEGYGLTETSAVAALNGLDERRTGSVGRALPGCQVRVDGDGELLLAGPHIFGGYFRDEEATAGTMEDGWLRTGDLARIDEDGFVHITGRKKELIVTASGKNVAPANVEQAIQQSRWIVQAIVHGDRRPYLVALVALDPGEAGALAREAGAESEDPGALARDSGVHAVIRDAVTAANQRFSPNEQVKRFCILPRELSVEEGELTPTLKVKRSLVNERYRDDLERLYGDEAGPADVWLERS